MEMPRHRFQVAEVSGEEYRAASRTLEGSVYVQMCIKGVSGITSREADDIISGSGLRCNWWRRQETITPREYTSRLTATELSLHINSYGEQHPERKGKIREETPFISMTAGAVERSTFHRTNFFHPAHRTALLFASNFGEPGDKCFLFYCWVIVGLSPAVEVMQLSEEVRELNTYRRYSAFQTEGEIAAKIEVTAPQIEKYERYRVWRPAARVVKFSREEEKLNPLYVDPYSIVNIREAF
jgi:hypothetical protein